MIRLKDSSIFIADSHYNSDRIILHTLLRMIEKQEIITQQIFLMGDIFDFLSYEINYFININSDIISLINRLSSSIEIIYHEGNHDFNLANIFPKLKVIARESQPLKIIHNKKEISIAHGDIFTPVGYNIYSKIIRNHYILKLLNFIDINNWLSKKIEKDLKKKDICHKQKNFESFVQTRIKNYKTDLAIEGHFHQGYISDKYINIPSLCCDKKYMIYSNDKFIFHSL